MGVRNIVRILNTLDISNGDFGGDIITEDDTHMVLDTNLVIYTKSVTGLKKSKQLKEAEDMAKKEQLTTYDNTRAAHQEETTKFIMEGVDLLYTEVCKIKQEMSLLRHALMTKMPNTVNTLMPDMKGHMMESRGEGILIKECKRIDDYKILHNRMLITRDGSAKCYKNLPVNISGEIMFLDLTTRNVIQNGMHRECTDPPPVILTKDTQNVGYKLSESGIWTKVKLLSKSIHDRIKIPKIHDYNPKWIINDKLRIPRESIMDLIQESQVLTRTLLSESSDQDEIWNDRATKDNWAQITKEGKKFIDKATDTMWTPIKKQLLKILYTAIPIITVILALTVAYCILKRIRIRRARKIKRFQHDEAQYDHEAEHEITEMIVRRQ